MTQAARQKLIVFVLGAMLLRGFVPTGWMPGGTDAFVRMCTAGGLIEVPLTELSDSDAGSSGHESTDNTLCAFAVASTLAAAPDRMQPDLVAVLDTHIVWPAPPAFYGELRYRSQPARAPPPAPKAA